MADMYLGLEALEQDAQRLERNGQAEFAHALRLQTDKLRGAVITSDAILEDAAEADTSGALERGAL